MIDASQWWSWGLAIIGISGLYLTTKKLPVGFLVGVLVQLLWIAYAFASGQWGFIVSAICYGAVNALGWYRWTISPPVDSNAAAQKL